MQRGTRFAMFTLAIVGAVVSGVRAEQLKIESSRPAVTPGVAAASSISVIKVEGAIVAQGLSAAEAKGLRRHRGEGSTAGTIPGTIVYDNFIIPAPGENLFIWTPGINPPGTTTELMADDLELAASGSVTGYSLAVGSVPELGAPPSFTVRTALWTGPPCEPGSTMIAGTEAVSPAIPNNGTGQLIEVVLTTPVATPQIVWLSAGFSITDAGWIIAEEAETGYTRDLLSENDIDGGSGCAQLFLGGVPYVGFWATVYSNLSFTPTGACCNGTTCSTTTQAACTGTFFGAFSSCEPDPCLTGACCGGGNFGVCVDQIDDPDLGLVPVTEVACLNAGGLFYSGESCTAGFCGPRFPVYVNDGPFDGLFLQQDDPVVGESLLADDLSMGPGAPCGLDHYDLQVYGLSFSGAYDVEVELWSVNSTTGNPEAVIPGTQRVFTNVGDGAFRTLRAGPFDGITVPENALMVIHTSTNLSGWILSDRAEVGSTEDLFFIFNDPVAQDQWAIFEFQPTPSRPIPPYAGFKSAIWCQGETPTGACCNDIAGSCLDGVTQQQCDGRWVEAELCAFNPFTPPCGAAACCTGTTCQDIVPLTCEGLGGVSAPRRFCADIAGIGCPRSTCINAPGDCFVDHRPGIGCEDPYCCEAVCDQDSFCCNPANGWDLQCAQQASQLCQVSLPDDNCSGALAINGEGEFPFDNTLATTDGMGHANCETGLTDPTDPQVANDVWRCWTAPCSGDVFVQSCNFTNVDTKIAVYEGCKACPPGDDVLLDCDDDFCGYDSPSGRYQSQVIFNAQQGQSYLIRIGTFPGGGPYEEADGGPGAISITCGVPNHHNCPNEAIQCFVGSGEFFGCDDQTCCDTVCACDPYCCEVVWDADCADDGFEGNGCGAVTLCSTCPSGAVAFVTPPSGVVDARQPFPPNLSATKQGLKSFIVSGPPGLDNPACWALCETAVEGAANSISGIVDNLNGTFTVNLARAISTNAVTTLTYTAGDATVSRGVFTFQPANVNGDSASSPGDIIFLIDILNGVQVAPHGLLSSDTDRSNAAGPPDILRVIDLLNAAAGFPNQLNRAKPICGACCP